MLDIPRTGVPCQLGVTDLAWRHLHHAVNIVDDVHVDCLSGMSPLLVFLVDKLLDAV